MDRLSHAATPEQRQTLKAEARRLRGAMSPGERVVWSHLRDNQLGVRFRRRAPVAGHLPSFYCPALKLALDVVPEGAPSRDDVVDGLQLAGVDTITLREHVLRRAPDRALARVRYRVRFALGATTAAEGAGEGDYRG